MFIFYLTRPRVTIPNFFLMFTVKYFNVTRTFASIVILYNMYVYKIKENYFFRYFVTHRITWFRTRFSNDHILCNVFVITKIPINRSNVSRSSFLQLFSFFNKETAVWHFVARSRHWLEGMKYRPYLTHKTTDRSAWWHPTIWSIYLHRVQVP